MLLNILLLLAVALAVVLLVAAFRSDDCRVVRSTVIAAPAEAAFPYVNNLRKWQEISPYAKLDPSATYTLSGPESGPGATLAWKGNNKLGEGSFAVTESIPSERVRLRLLFVRPFKCDNVVEFTFVPESASHTRVTWSMSGKSNFIAKVMSLVIDMDKMVGRDFEAGLATLKARAEADAKS